MSAGATRARTVTVHGRQLTYRSGGQGPPLVLIHGIGGSSATWGRTARLLARSHTVIAPDLLGHGRSAPARGDYSLGANTNAVRDLLDALGHRRVTIVGHSLGGGIGAQFAYQYPDRCERLVLVSSGGFGREIHPLLRVASLPGSGAALDLLAAAGVLKALRGARGLLARLRLVSPAEATVLADALTWLEDPAARDVFFDTLRAVVDLGGQRISALGVADLLSAIPTLLVWGDRDPVIPIEHGRALQAALGGIRLEVFAGAGHSPQLDFPDRFAALVQGFTAPRPAVKRGRGGLAVMA